MDTVETGYCMQYLFISGVQEVLEKTNAYSRHLSAVSELFQSRNNAMCALLR
jgi:hypothetical protein